MTELESSSLDIVAAQLNELHARTWLRWRNDSETRAMSVHSKEQCQETYLQDFAHTLSHLPDLVPFFLAKEGRLMAFVEFRSYSSPRGGLRKACEIGLVVAPEERRKGIGQCALQAAREWAGRAGFDEIYATIKPQNAVSKKLFLSADYQRVGETKRWGDLAERVDLELYRYSLTPQPLSASHAVFIIAEAGSNWKSETEQKSWDRACALIEKAADAGADAIKFQTFRPETLYAKRAGTSRYLQEGGENADMEELFERLAMPYEMIPRLASVCQENGILFLSTPFSVEDFEQVDPFVSIHKLASYEIGHLRLIEKMAATGKPVLMSTGAAIPDEIRWAVRTFRERGGGDLFLLQCTAAYPTPMDALNLGAIPWLQKTFRTGVGLSDHSRDPLIGPLAAVALGARVIEKHYTLRDAQESPDKVVSIFPDELKEMVKAIRGLEEAFGSGRKSVLPVEEELRRFARRGVQALRAIAAGDLFVEGKNIAILRPGNQTMGVHPRYLEEIEGQKSKRHITEGEGIKDGDW